MLGLSFQRARPIAATPQFCTPAPSVLYRLSHPGPFVARVSSSPGIAAGGLSPRPYKYTSVAGSRPHHILHKSSSSSCITRQLLGIRRAPKFHSDTRSAIMSNGSTAPATKPVLFLYDGLIRSLPPCLGVHLA